MSRFWLQQSLINQKKNKYNGWGVGGDEEEMGEGVMRRWGRGQ